MKNISKLILYAIKYRWVMYWILPACFSMFVMFHTTFSPWVNFFVSIVFTGFATIGFCEICESLLKWYMKRFMASRMEAMQKEIVGIFVRHMEKESTEEQRPSVH